MNPFSLQNKIVLITGASSGIGYECAVKCAQMGANLLLLGRNMERLEKVKNEVEVWGVHVEVISVDITNVTELESVIAAFVSKYGKFDGFVHSAGIEKTLPVVNLKQSDYIDILKINAFAGFELCKLLSKKKYGNEGASFVLISSITSMIGRAGLTAYSASKGAINAGIRPIAIEIASKKMRVNAICPGTILTPLMLKFLDTLTEEEKFKRNSGYLLGLGECADVANLVLFLLSDGSLWITGQSIAIDGGYTIQ